MAIKSIFTAIVGRPNVGKSTLLNTLIGEKAAIVTAKPQTTRSRITGIVTKGETQYVFIDTPGFHKSRNKLDESMGRVIRESLSEVDAVLMVFEPFEALTEQETLLVELIGKEKLPAIGVLNKVDAVAKPAALFSMTSLLEQTGAFQKVLPVSAKTGEGCAVLLEALLPYAVDGPHFFPEDAFTDLPEKWLVSEIVREKLLLFMQDEIPHGTAVDIELFKERKGKPMVDIDAVIYCERKSHKGMIIGKGGQMLKKIATAAREDIEKLLGAKVFLQCWVKVKPDWRDDETKIRQVGLG